MIIHKVVQRLKYRFTFRTIDTSRYAHIQKMVNNFWPAAIKIFDCNWIHFFQTSFIRAIQECDEGDSLQFLNSTLFSFSATATFIIYAVFLRYDEYFRAILLSVTGNVAILVLVIFEDILIDFKLFTCSFDLICLSSSVCPWCAHLRYSLHSVQRNLEKTLLNLTIVLFWANFLVRRIVFGRTEKLFLWFSRVFIVLTELLHNLSFINKHLQLSK